MTPSGRSQAIALKSCGVALVLRYLLQGFPSGHWFLVGQQAEEVNNSVAKWLDERYKAAPAAAAAL